MTMPRISKKLFNKIKTNGYYSQIHRSKPKVSKQYVQPQKQAQDKISMSNSEFKHYLYHKLCEILNLYSNYCDDENTLFYNLNNLLLAMGVKDTYDVDNSYYFEWTSSRDVVDKLLKDKPYHDSELSDRLEYLSTHKSNKPIIILYKQHDYIPLTYCSLWKCTWTIYNLIIEYSDFTPDEKQQAIKWCKVAIKYATEN